MIDQRITVNFPLVNSLQETYLRPIWDCYLKFWDVQPLRVYLVFSENMFRNYYYKIKVNKGDVCFASKVVASGHYWKKPRSAKILFYSDFIFSL